MVTLQQWLNEYGQSHKNETNKLIHWVCVPAIFFSIVGLLSCVKLPFAIGRYELNLAVVVLLGVLVYYASLSVTIMIGMMVFSVGCLALANFIETNVNLALWGVSVIVFTLAWVGQFYGHKIEGKKPSFLKDIQFLMIGPAWLMHFVYKKVGIKW